MNAIANNFYRTLRIDLEFVLQNALQLSIFAAMEISPDAPSR